MDEETKLEIDAVKTMIEAVLQIDLTNTVVRKDLEDCVYRLQGILEKAG